jgi:twinkle protein
MGTGQFETLSESNLAEQLLWTQTGRVSWDKVERAMRYAVKRHGADFLLLDSLMMLGVGKEDYEKQAALAAELAQFAIELDVHVFLVAHSRKRGSAGGGESKPPGKDDVRGAGELVDAASNALAWWRDIGREIKMDEAKENGDVHKQIDLASKSHGCAVLLKQRSGSGKSGMIRFFFDPDSGQFWQRKGYRRAYFGLENPEQPKEPEKPADGGEF